MIAYLIAQAAALAPLPLPDAAPSAAVASEIASIEQAMENWQGGVYKKDGQLACRISRSSGDEAIDAIQCGAMLRCYAPVAARLDAIAALDVDRDERARQMRPVVATTRPCIAQASKAGVRMLAEQRAG